MVGQLIEAWPPDYCTVLNDRKRRLLSIRARPEVMLQGAKEYYRTRPIEFIEHWCFTYDPRNAGKKNQLTTIPFIMFPRQREFVEFLYRLLGAEECGLIEKCRDMGATWLGCAFSIWLWLYWSGAAIGWGSRKEQLVDRAGDPDSIFEKMRMIIWNLPREFWPVGFNPRLHMTKMKIVNPENQSTITGEIGDSIGRGGRKLIYFKDEALITSSNILTPTGWKTMADIEIGSSVIGRDGQSHNVIGINNVGLFDVYKINFSDGTFIKCSPNHLWTVYNVRKKGKITTLRTTDIKNTFKYVSPGGQTQYNYRLPVCSPVQFKESETPLPLHPYIVGALLGDGSVGDVPKHSPRITTADEEIIEQFRVLLPNGCTLTQEKDRITWRLGDEVGSQGYKHKSRSRVAVVDSGIAGLRSHEKYVPEKYLFASIEDRLSLLQGLMDTDGSAANNYGGSASFHTCSERLANDVRFIVQSLGGTASFNVKKDKRGYRDQYVLHINLPDGMIPFRISRKVNALKKRKHPPQRTIVGVEYAGKDTVKCISLDSEDGLYLTDHCIVTHNSAHYEHPEAIEAALGDNTRIQIDISSVNGVGNVFHRRRKNGWVWSPGEEVTKGKTNVFIFDYRDHPNKTEAWFNERRQKAIDEGLYHLFAQEVERNYDAARPGKIIEAQWVNSAIDAHIKLGFDDSGGYCAGLDVADAEDVGDRNALAIRKGVILKSAFEWGDRDTGVTTRRCLDAVTALGSHVDVQYDCIGVGAGVKAEVNRLTDEHLLPNNIIFIPWNAGAGPLDPEGFVEPNDMQTPLNKDFYSCLKAQGWWKLRRRFEKTHRAVTEEIKYDPAELISLPSSLPILWQIVEELTQPTASKGARLKLVIDKKPEGERSPNVGDAIMMAYWPISDGLADWMKLAGL